jgi:hypothetical protein
VYRLAIAAWTASSIAAGLSLLPIGPPALAGAPESDCAPALAAQRARWHAVGPALVQPPAGPGETLTHWPTDTFGTWLVQRVGPGETSLTRVTPERLSRIRWSAACVASNDERERRPAAGPAFTDRDLDALLAAPGRGVIYVWSPHMPLSVDGWAELMRAAASRRLTVEPLLDPQADRGFAAASTAGGRLPASALRVVDSVELQFRELALHAPSVAVFAGGRLVGPLLRGYRTADEYGDFFDRVLPK